MSQRIDIAEEGTILASERARSLRTQNESLTADLRAHTEEAQARLLETKAARELLEASVGGVAASGESVGGRARAEKFLR